jgi:hypothetical protein
MSCESDESSHAKVATAAAGIAFDFGLSNVGKACITSLETCACYFPKGYCKASGTKTVSESRANEAVVFEDLLTAGLRMPPHPVLAEILQKFRVHLHQLTPNTIVQIGKFIWAVSSCRGYPTADLFTTHYELHYQQKKLKLKGNKNKLAAQFGCITFHPTCRAKLTPAVKNKWSSGWVRNWFYYKVPSYKADVHDKGTYLLRSEMRALDYLTGMPHDPSEVMTQLKSLSLVESSHSVMTGSLRLKRWNRLSRRLPCRCGC